MGGASMLPAQRDSLFCSFTLLSHVRSNIKPHNYSMFESWTTKHTLVLLTKTTFSAPCNLGFLLENGFKSPFGSSLWWNCGQSQLITERSLYRSTCVTCHPFSTVGEHVLPTTCDGIKNTLYFIFSERKDLPYALSRLYGTSPSSDHPALDVGTLPIIYCVIDML